jgi:hypothetical protein
MKIFLRYSLFMFFLSNGIIIPKIEASEYKLFGNIVYKLNSNNTVEWAVNFDGKINPAHPDSNHLVSLAFDGQRIYIQEIQGYFSSSPTRYAASIVMDTMGNVRYIRGGYDDPMLPQYLGAAGCYPSLTGGAWMNYSISTGIGNVFQMMKIDSLGYQIASSKTLSFLQTNTQPIVLPLPDSTYLIIMRTYGTGTYGLCAFYKMNEQGDIIYGKAISDQNMVDNLEAWAACADSSGNYYIFGIFTQIVSGNQKGNFAFKFDSLGNLVAQNTWLNNRNYFTSANFRNDSIHLEFVNPPTYNIPFFATMDTSLIPLCYDPSVIKTYSVQTIFSPGNTNTLGNQLFSFTPTAISYIPNFVPQAIDYCPVVSTEEIFQQDTESIKFFPNPGNEKIILYSPNILLETIRIFNMSGNLVLEKSNLLHGEEINVTSLGQGIYFAKIGFGGKFINRKFILTK